MAEIPDNLALLTAARVSIVSDGTVRPNPNLTKQLMDPDYIYFLNPNDLEDRLERAVTSILWMADIAREIAVENGMESMADIKVVHFLQHLAENPELVAKHRLLQFPRLFREYIAQLAAASAAN